MKQRISKKLFQIGTIFIFITGIILNSSFIQGARADSSMEVNSYNDVLADDGACTLREAVIAANEDAPSGSLPGECPAGSGNDTIILPAGTYQLTRDDNGFEDSTNTGDLDIFEDLTVQGAGADLTWIEFAGSKQMRIFHVLNGTVTISGITISKGVFRGEGGGISNAGVLTLSDVLITDSHSDIRGGGIFNSGDLTIRDSAIIANSAGEKGGGIFNAGSLDLLNVTISGNQVIHTGGDVAETDPGGEALVTVLDIPEDISISGGGLYNAAGQANIAFTTFAANGVSAGAGGENVQLMSGGSIQVSGGEVALNSTILSDPTSLGNCSGTITSQGYNLSSDSSCSSYFNQAGDLNDSDPLLGNLDDNGGTTPTHALLPGSPAADKGDNSTCPARDQRGAPRPEGEGCDIGAFELGSFESWVTAKRIYPSVTLYEYISKPNQSRWYKFDVQPGSQVIAALTELPENYDLTMYKDIAQAYQSLTTTDDLLRLGAEFAPDAFSPDAFSPDAFSPDAFSPDAFSPDAFSPDAFSPDAFSPDAFSPDAFSPDAFSPDAFSPDAFSPDAFSPDAFSPDAFSPDAYSPDAFSPDAFSGAQMQSLIAVSAFEGTAGEGIRLNTWDNDGDFYLRVRGRNGAFNTEAPFRLDVLLIPGECSAVSSDSLPETSLSGTSGGYSTIILTDLDRMTGTTAEKDDLQAELSELSLLPEVNGVIVDVGSDARVAAANAQADAYPACPYAKNIVADSIKYVIDNYRSSNPLDYVVIIGNDETIPFFRHPDQAMLANEKNFAPPVLDSTASQASLKLGFILSQDRYGSDLSISAKGNLFPIPNLAVGRLGENPAEVVTMLEAYKKLNAGVLPQPTTALVTGYDFLEDSSLAILAELESGIGATADTLITPHDVSPQDPSAWTADQLRSLLLGSRHDVVFLAGHFSASSALAADYTTRLLSSEVAQSQANLENSLIYSIGCHSGYNIVDLHGVPGLTREPDWAQSFASKGATLIAGTGYQYGDTQFIEYSERLYLEFTRLLNSGSGPVPIGKALVAAKQKYLADTAQMKGIHEKALLEATLYGLPMLSLDMPGSASTVSAPVSDVPATIPFSSNPGSTLGLEYADLTVTPNLTEHQVELTNPSDGSTSTATYLSGSAGIVTNPTEPVLPLEIRDVSVSGLVARGVGFRGGTYTDLLNILPLTGAATTEIRGVHTPFLSDVFFPIVPWRLNYLEALFSGSNGSTRLFYTPAQYKSDPDNPVTGVMRKFTQANFRLFYSNNLSTYGGGSIPALAAPPDIAEINAIPGADEIQFQVRVLGNPSAGIQEVWIVYTAESGLLAGSWQPLDLTQNSQDSSIWEGVLPLNGLGASEIRYMVQAVNGVGLVSVSTNQGVSYIPGQDSPDKEPTALTLELPASSAPYGSLVTFGAVLTSGGSPQSGKIVFFGLGSQVQLGITDSNGRATASIPLLGLPGDYDLKATFPGSLEYQASSNSSPFTITKASTNIALYPSSASGTPDEEGLLVAYLSDNQGRPLGEKSVFFIVSDGTSIHAEAAITDYAGRAFLGKLPLPPGTYTVQAYFSGAVSLSGITLNLSDDRYQPATTSGDVTLTYPNEIFFPFFWTTNITPP